jgi:predicted secreted protein
VKLDLEVTTTLGGMVSLVQQARVPLTMVDRLTAGSTVPVIVSSTDPSKMIIEWTGLVPPSAPATPQPSTAEPGRTP